MLRVEGEGYMPVGMVLRVVGSGYGGGEGGLRLSVYKFGVLGFRV